MAQYHPGHTSRWTRAIHMKRTLLSLVVVALLATSSVAHAAGVNLSWDDCGVAGTENKTFACDVNSGPAMALVASFRPPEGNEVITGMEVVIDFGSATNELPNWWQFFTTGACRRTSLTASADFANYPYFTCRDFWGAQAVGGITNYLMPYANAPCRSRLLLVFAWPETYWTSLDPQYEHYAFRLAIARDKTVGSGSCAGCLVPVAIVVNDLKLTQPYGFGDYRLQSPIDRNWVSWQGATPWQSCLWVPTRNTTWGAIKGQYR